MLANARTGLRERGQDLDRAPGSIRIAAPNGTPITTGPTRRLDVEALADGTWRATTLIGVCRGVHRL